MASNRIGRINDDIQRVLSDRLRSVKDPRVSDQGMITVTRVETTGDLRYAKVWLSVFDLKDEKEFKKGLKSASGWLRREQDADFRSPVRLAAQGSGQRADAGLYPGTGV